MKKIKNKKLFKLIKKALKKRDKVYLNQTLKEEIDFENENTLRNTLTLQIFSFPTKKQRKDFYDTAREIKKQTSKIDTSIFGHVSPNDIGEYLREKSFKEERGCYSCFDVEETFTKIEEESAVMRLVYLIYDLSPYEIIEQEDIDRCHFYTDGKVNMGWYWEGDGVLMFEEIETGKIVVNYDCKKEYRWQFYE